MEKIKLLEQITIRMTNFETGFKFSWTNICTSATNQIDSMRILISSKDIAYLKPSHDRILRSEIIYKEAKKRNNPHILVG
jgi:hypothetical protein